MADFLSFKARLNGFQASERLDQPPRGAVAAFLDTLEEVARTRAFTYLPLDVAKIREAAAPAADRVSSPAGLPAALAALKPGKIDEALGPFVQFNKPVDASDDSQRKKADEQNAGLRELAFSCYVNALFEKAFPPRVKTTAVQGNEVTFAVRLGDWLAVKKTPAKASGPEVAACLAGLHALALRRLPVFACADADAFDALVAKAAGEPRKSFARLAIVLNEAVKNSEAARGLAQPGFEDAMERAFFVSCMQTAGFSPAAMAEAVGRAFPEVKVVKPRGNYGSKRKKPKPE